MNFKKLLFSIYLLLALVISTNASSQNLSADARTEVGEVLSRIVAREILGGYVKVDRTKAAGDRLDIYASVGLSYYPFREDNVRAMYDSVRSVLPEKYAKYKISLHTDNHLIEELIPIYHRTAHKGAVRFTNTSNQPLVTSLSKLSISSPAANGK